jgi:hypothetical protein
MVLRIHSREGFGITEFNSENPTFLLHFGLAQGTSIELTNTVRKVSTPMFWVTVAEISNIWTYDGRSHRLGPLGGDNQRVLLFFNTTIVIRFTSQFLSVYQTQDATTGAKTVNNKDNNKSIQDNDRTIYRTSVTIFGYPSPVLSQCCEQCRTVPRVRACY